LNHDLNTLKPLENIFFVFETFKLQT